MIKTTLKYIAAAFFTAILFTNQCNAYTDTFNPDILIRDDNLDESWDTDVFNQNGKIFTLEQKRILDYIKPSPVKALVKSNAVLHVSADKTSGRIAVLNRGETVEILQDSSAEWYRVKTPDSSRKGWIQSEFIEIEPDAPVDTSTLSEENLNEYANALAISSKTKYLIITDIGRQRTYIYSGEKSGWSHIKTLVCSTGKNESPTVRGKFTIGAKGEWFYSERLQGGAKYWVRFYGSYLFHSVAMDKSKKVVDGILGEKRSSGCIRLGLDDAEWFYNTIPAGTTVLVI